MYQALLVWGSCAKPGCKGHGPVSLGEAYELSYSEGGGGAEEEGSPSGG